MSTDPITTPEVVLACDLNAIPAAERDTHEATGTHLFTLVQEIQAQADGYAFRLLTESAVIVQAAQFVKNERLCCPFFHFTLDIEPNGGAFWLRLTGSAQIKEMIKAEFGNYLPAQLAEAAGFLRRDTAA